MHQQIRIVCVYVAMIVQKYNCIIGIHEFRLQGKKHKKRDGDRERCCATCGVEMVPMTLAAHASAISTDLEAA